MRDRDLCHIFFRRVLSTLIFLRLVTSEKCIYQSSQNINKLKLLNNNNKKYVKIQQQFPSTTYNNKKLNLG